MKIFEARIKPEYVSGYLMFPFSSIPTLYIEDEECDLGMFVYTVDSSLMTYYLDKKQVELVKDKGVQEPEEPITVSEGGISLKTLIGEGVRKVEISYE